MSEFRHILNLVSPPEGHVVDLKEMRDSLRLDDDAEDSILRDAIATATEYVERTSGKQLLTAMYELKLPEFPRRQIAWPRPPLKEVESITYQDSSGEWVVLPESDYVVELGSEGSAGFVRPAINKCWPVTMCDDLTVVIRGVCGFGKKCDVPQVLRQQIRGLAYHWFANRSAVSCGDMSEVPLSLSVLQSHTMRREFI